METRVGAEHHPVVLVVDDDPDQLHLLSILLKREQYQVIQAHSVVEGLDIVNTKDVDIIISDVAMPEMNGYDFAEKVKTNHNSSNVPVFLISAGLQLVDCHSVDFKADGFFLKKNLQETLIPTIKEFL